MTSGRRSAAAVASATKSDEGCFSKNRSVVTANHAKPRFLPHPRSYSPHTFSLTFTYIKGKPAILHDISAVHACEFVEMHFARLSYC